MPSILPPPQTRIMWRIAAQNLALLLLLGCQSYEPVPLDIGAYRAFLDTRLFDMEPGSAFARHLQAMGDDAPLQFDRTNGISHAEGEALALFYNPDLRIARLEAGVALATREHAGLWQDPVFGFDGADIISPSSPFEFSLMGSLTVPITGRLEAEKDRADAAYEVRLRSVFDAEWRTRAQLRRKWAAWTAAVAQAELLSQMSTQLKKISDVADSLEAAGELNRIEHRLLRIEVADRIVQGTEMDLQVLEAETALLEVLGLPPGAAGQLIPGFPDIATPVFDDVTDRLIEVNTELAVHFAEYRAAEETLRLEIKKQFPDIEIGSGYGTEFNDRRVLFGLSVPIPILNANRPGIAEASARREVARAAAETTYARLFRELTAAYMVLEVKRSQRERYEQLIIPMLDEQTSDIRRIAELGEIDMFVLLETMTRTIDTRQRLIELRLEELDAAVTVRQILGPNGQNDRSPDTRGLESRHQNTMYYDAIVTGGAQ